MRYLVIGFFLGLIVNIFIFPLQGGFNIAFDWHSQFDNFDVKKNNHINLKDSVAFSRENSLTYVDLMGNISKSFMDEGKIYASSGNGQFFSKYEKVGSEVTFHGNDGVPYWKLHSREYPNLSYNGKVILLENGDQSALSVYDNNGNNIGVKRIYGRLCTNIAFSERRDFSAVGFADGHYTFINEKGNIIYQGVTKGIVKGIAISSNGKYGAVVSGDSKKDLISVIEFEDQEIETSYIGFATRSKNSLYVSEEGEVYLLKGNHIFGFDLSSDLKLRIKIEMSKEGSAIFRSFGNDIALGYPVMGSNSRLMVFKKSGEVLFSKEFNEIPYIDLKIISQRIIVRGKKDLFSYIRY